MSDITVWKEITTVYDHCNTWDGPNGTIHYVKVLCSDGSEMDTGVKEQNVEAEKDRMRALVGLSCQFVVKSKGEFNGIDQFQIRDYPGKYKSNLPSIDQFRSGSVGAGHQPVQTVSTGKEWVSVAPPLTPTPEVGILAHMLALNIAVQINQSAEMGQHLQDAEAYLALAEDWLRGKTSVAPGDVGTPGDGATGEPMTGAGVPVSTSEEVGASQAPAPSSDIDKPTDSDMAAAREAFGVGNDAEILSQLRSKFRKPTSEITSDDVWAFINELEASKAGGE